MQEFPSNQKYTRPREEPKAEIEPRRVERVVHGEIVRRKKPLLAKMKETFIGDDSTSVGEYVLLDVIIPAFKDLAYDAAMEIMGRSLFGGAMPPSRHGAARRHVRGAGPTNYNGFSRDPRDRRDRDRDEPRQMSRRGRANFEFDEVILNMRVEAQEALEKMYDLLEQYDAVTVADLYNAIGVTPEHTDYKYGWTDLRGSSISHQRNGGYLLNLPRPEQLER